ncbi:hypothetical protein LUZ60_015503 [Juncus effusus]|nr:hypothetical protein LUZ60_015503 [Juncus effusus]
MGSASTDPLLPDRRRMLTRNFSRADDELRSFRACLRWLCIDLTGLPFDNIISWFLFTLLGVVVPSLCHYFLGDLRPYDSAVQMSLTGAATVAFLSLSTLVRRYGLRRSLFLDRLRQDSDRVRIEYKEQLGGAFRFLALLLLPCSIADALHKSYWYYCSLSSVKALVHMPKWMASPYVASAICALEIISFMYRTAILLLDCVLFRLNCGLQILRMEDFVKVFHAESDVGNILKQHMRIRKQLRIISHRYRSFIVSCLVVVTASQFWTLLLMTRPHSQVNLITTGELVLCSMSLVMGVLMCLRSAAKITHRTQSITSRAATWHVCATVDPSDLSIVADDLDPDKNNNEKNDVRVVISNGSDSSDDSGSEREDVKKLLAGSRASAISYQKRQALVTYLENNKAGISVFGFVVDRTWLHALFMIEFSLVMWLLGKTVGI